MKKRIYIIACIALFFGGCGEDFLDKKPVALQSTDSFLSDPLTAEANFQQMLNATYSIHTFSETTWRNSKHYFESMISDWTSDDCQKGGNGTGDMPEALTWRSWSVIPGAASTVHEGTPYIAGYLGTGRANAILGYLETYKASLTDATYNRMKGEALFLRGYFYLLLTRIYGSVPYYDKPVTAADYFTSAKMAPEELYKLIEQDFTDAISILPTKSQWPSWPGGKATKGAAGALLARTITMEIGFGFNGKTWQDVYDVTNVIINSEEYTLEPNYAYIFTTGGEMGTESIYEVPCSDLGGVYGATGSTQEQRMVTFRPQANLTYAAGLPSGGWGFSTPTQDLFNQYEPGDPRRACTMIDSGEYFMGREIPIIIDNTNPTGFWSRKMAGPDPRLNTSGSNNVRLVRYAEVLLTHAEAAYHIGQEGEAKSTLDIVRARAQASSLPYGSKPGDNASALPGDMPTIELGPVTATTGQALLDAIKHERRIELATEGQRLWDLIRWGDMENAIRTSIIPEDRFLGDLDPEAVVANYRSHLIDGKVPCFPIPSDEVSTYHLEQNPGY